MVTTEQLNLLLDATNQYTKIAESIFVDRGRYEIAQGYKQCREMLNHVHELLVAFNKDIEGGDQ